MYALLEHTVNQLLRLNLIIPGTRAAFMCTNLVLMDKGLAPTSGVAFPKMHPEIELK